MNRAETPVKGIEIAEARAELHEAADHALPGIGAHPQARRWLRQRAAEARAAGDVAELRRIEAEADRIGMDLDA